MGFVRIEDKAATLNCIIPDSASAFLLVGGQMLPLGQGQRVSLEAPVQAVVIADEKRLLLYGLAPDCRLSRSDLWTIISQNRTMHSMPQEDTPTVEEVSQEDYGVNLSHVPMFSEAAGIEDSEAATVAFSELLRRANAVYGRIAMQHEPMHRPAITEPSEPDAVLEPPATPKNDWLNEVDQMIKGLSGAERHSAVISNPFPNTFPNSSWTAVGGEGVMPHLEGEWQRGNELFKIIAVPGTYAPRPPKHLFGFTRFLRTRRGGFWIKLLDK